MKKTTKITATIFISLLLTLNSMPGVHAVSSQSPESGNQAISFQASEPEAKVSALLSLQVDTKTRCQQAPPTADELSMMDAMGMRTENLAMQRIFIHLAQEPTAAQIDELEAMGITSYPDSWIPPVGDYPAGFIVADMPIDKLDELAAKNYVVQLDTTEQMLEPQNDLGATKINADDVWTSGYDGTGVRIAVLDSGLDTTHPDIPALVASKDYSNWPVLDDTIANTVSGHGTHVTGSAVGRGTQSTGATHEYKGMAPGADLVFLKIGKDATGGAPLDAMTNAIKAAVDTYDADIITMSYGGWGYYHDGTRQTSQAVDYAFGEGAVVFISAGNEANDDQHYSDTVNANSTTDFIQVSVTGSNGGNAGLGFNLVWYDGLANRNDLVLEYYQSDQTPLADTWVSAQEESWKGTEHEFSGYGPDAGWYYYLPAGNLTYYLNVTNNSDNDQFFHIYFEGIASSGASVKFQNPDPFYTLGSPADAEKAIAVGAYTTRKSWTNYEGTVYHYINPEQTVDTMTSFSSRGPRVDSGAPQKPNIVAPGSAIISCRDQDVYLWSGGADAYFIDNDGLNLDGSGPADYYVMQGTSMASPTAAGAAALLLEAKPELKGHPAAVRNLLQATATSVEDNDNIDGYGLLDIQAAIDASAADLEADWLFMVYLDADNNLESAGIDDLNEMEVSGSTDSVKIVVQMDRAERDWDDDTTNGNWTDAKRFYVTRDTDAAIINSPVIADLGEVNMGDPATLQSFIEWTIANYPAQHYALVLWDHGSGWRERNTTATMKSICVDDQANDELTMTELRSALNAANVTTGETLDIIGFDACLMEMVEVVYQVMGSTSRPLVDIAVGSEETEPGDGWDYAHTLTALTANPAMTPTELATQIVNDYISSYDPTLGITQSAAKLSLIDELATAIDSFAQAMTSATDDWDAIKTARGQTQEYYYDYYIDLYHFAQLINQDTSISQAVRDATSLVMTAVNNAVIAEGHTSSVANSHGLSIYYPETVTDYFSDYETSLLFTTDTQWDEFLSAILSSDTTPPTVSSVSPEADATDVAVDTTVSATFDEAMAELTITTSSFTLDSVSGSVSYNSGTYTATFTPDTNLTYNTTYTATLSTDITDAAGNPLASAYSWSFTTEAGVIVSIDAPDEVCPNSDFTANVNITEVVDFRACYYDVSFDASVLQLDDVTWGLIGSVTIPVDPYWEISSGTWRVVQNIPGFGVSGSGYLAVLHFHVIGSEGDSSTISLSNGRLSNNQAEEIPAIWTGDSVDVMIPPVLVSIDAPDEAAPDSDFTANVNITDVVDFDACNYDVSFDASVLELSNVTSGLIGLTTIPVDIYNEVSSGTYRIIQNVPGLTGVSGSGYLAVLHFHVIGSQGDSSAISLSNGMLANNLAEEIEVTWVGDSVSVTSVLPGDATGDGVVDSRDITKVERIMVGLDAETPGADATGDGVIDSRDITKVEIIMAGLG